MDAPDDDRDRDRDDDAPDDEALWEQRWTLTTPVPVSGVG